MCLNKVNSDLAPQYSIYYPYYVTVHSLTSALIGFINMCNTYRTLKNNVLEIHGYLSIIIVVHSMSPVSTDESQRTETF